MIKLPLPADMKRCLGHPEGWQAVQAPDQWCPERETCARHKTIAVDPFDGTCTVVPRACVSELMAAYIPIEGFPARDEE